MQYEQLENDIVTRLTPAIAGVDVLALPDKQSEFLKPFKSGRITACYKGSKYGKVLSTNRLSQQETTEFEIMIEARLLRGPAGVYAFLERVKSLILGYKLTNTDKVFLIDQTIITGAGPETFMFTMAVACTLLVAEETETPEDYENEFYNPSATVS